MTEDLKQRLYERGIEDVEMSFHNVEKSKSALRILDRATGRKPMLESTSILRMPLLNTSTPEIMLVFLRNQQWKV